MSNVHVFQYLFLSSVGFELILGNHKDVFLSERHGILYVAVVAQDLSDIVTFQNCKRAPRVSRPLFPVESLGSKHG